MQVKKTVLAKRTIVLGVAGILLAGAAVAAVGVSIRSGQTIVGAFGPAGDVNGDGNTDLFVKVGQNVEIRPGTAQGVFSSTPIGRAEIPADYYQYVSPYSVGDVNGDGFDDV
ncbi:MAG: VCBS repeat-containing protein, partial [Oligoflexia bacterium]|nr:VCBS repeat-containing protein [Oligoflexia bacterium]